MKKKNQPCAGINSFSGGAAAGIGARELLSASLLSAEKRLGWGSGFQELWSCDSLNKIKP